MPSWIQELARSDRYYRGVGAGEPASLEEVFAENNVQPKYMEILNRYTAVPVPADGYDRIDISQDVYPSTLPMIIALPGTFRELSAGELDFGIVRDSTLNSINQVVMQHEYWSMTHIFGPSCAFKRFNITGLCANGAIGPRIDVCAEPEVPAESINIVSNQTDTTQTGQAVQQTQSKNGKSNFKKNGGSK
jgi:hypothetical protein